MYTMRKKMEFTLAVGENGALLDTDNFFPNLALNHPWCLCWDQFFVGYRAAFFFKCCSSLTALTTSLTYDFLDISHNPVLIKKA